MSTGLPRLPKIAIEVVVIVGSILLAFGIEAAWEERGERVREQEAILSLTREFEGIDSELDRLERLWRGGPARPDTSAGGMWMAERILGAMNTEVSGLAADSMVAAVIVTDSGLRLPEGVLAALISSGDLSLLRSDSLRSALAGWAGFRGTVTRDAEGLGRLVNDHLIPYLWDRTQLRTVDVRNGFHEGLGESPFSHSGVGLLGDPYFENLVNERLILLETSVERLAEARNHVTLVLRLLAASRTDS